MAYGKLSHRTAITILSNSRKQGTPTLDVVREWLEVIVNQPTLDYFLRTSKQAR